MGLFDKMREPVFLKEHSNLELQLEKLRELEPLLNGEGRALLKQDIKHLEYGILGEKNIGFELKNSHMPMYILHDIYLEDGDLNAQIDYLVFTKKMCFVVECKNLYGNIEINNAGDFIRTIEYGGKKKKEGIYSPITQNQRHLELMKKIKKDSKKNILIKYMVERNFELFNKSVVVLANPKTVLNARFAKKEVKEKIIRADQLVRYIKRTYKNSKESPVSEKQLLEWAQSYLDLHKDVERDYAGKYQRYLISSSAQKDESEEVAIPAVGRNSTTTREIPIEETSIYKELKAYRLGKCREEKIKPYYIYNNNQLKDLIAKMPTNKKKLYKVAGFGEARVNKYGDDIIKIIEKHK